jgi:hypothetical protein
MRGEGRVPGAVPVSTYRSTARYDVDPGRLGRAVAKFEAASLALVTVAGALTIAVVTDRARSRTTR